ncbi:hypothetical protein ANCDUO_06705 [Ancylostoma duodenale]|uniref:Uncharacterized protein n=1 Tax=Ancylostoma duodenale TaxID=51022 RepID=A0A0C2GVD1_9BILA|nr:hypothetical protein ANCDUO_06705 [Ancylostoma duodenale]
MIGNEFVTDLCTLDHHPECTPIKTAHNLVDRTFNRGVEANTSYARKTPKPGWHEEMKTVKERAAEEPEMYLAMASHHYSKGCVSRRSSIKRVLKIHNHDEGGAMTDDLHPGNVEHTS